MGIGKEGGLPASYFKKEEEIHQLLDNGGTDALEKQAREGRRIEAGNLGLDKKPLTDEDKIAEYYRAKAASNTRFFREKREKEREQRKTRKNN